MSMGACVPIFRKIHKLLLPFHTCRSSLVRSHKSHFSVPTIRNVCTIDLKKELDLYLYWLLTCDFFSILSTPNIISASLLPSKKFGACMTKFYKRLLPIGFDVCHRMMTLTSIASSVQWPHTQLLLLRLWGVNEGWMPLPTRPQQYCDPVSLVSKSNKFLFERCRRFFGDMIMNSNWRPVTFLHC